MAKGNLFMGMARGSIGDITFWRGDNEQLSRSRNRKPSNPRTDRQLQSRIILKTVSSAYSLLMGDLANQTFQGAATSRENQRRFLSANARYLRQLVAEGAIADANFMGRDDTTSLLNRYKLSEGGLNPQLYSLTVPSPQSTVVTLDHTVDVGDRDITYQDVCSAFGVPAGTQLTIVLVRNNGGTINFVERHRLILAPASGDMSKNFMLQSVTGGINDPNPENDMGTGVVSYDGTARKIQIAFFGEFGACAVIASKLEGATWKYSEQQLYYSPTAGYGTHTLSDAIDSWKTAAAESDLYTRQSNLPDEQVVTAVTGIVSSNDGGDPSTIHNFDITEGSGSVHVDHEFNTVTFNVFGANLDGSAVKVGLTSTTSVVPFPFTCTGSGSHLTIITDPVDVPTSATVTAVLTVRDSEYRLTLQG